MRSGYYTVRQFAEMVQCHPKTIERKCRAREIVAIKPMGRWLIHSDQAEKILDPNTSPDNVRKMDGKLTVLHGGRDDAA